MALGVYVFLQYSDLGKALLRAAADEPEAALYMGISVTHMHRVAFGLGIALAAVAGGLLATFWPIEPTIALNFIVLMFVAVVLGGLGVFPAALPGEWSLAWCSPSVNWCCPYGCRMLACSSSFCCCSICGRKDSLASARAVYAPGAAPGSLLGSAVPRLCLGVALTLLLQERYHQRVLQLTMAWAIMGLAWNIISGYAGQISFGHQVFFGLGAYTTVMLMVYWHITPWLGLPGLSAGGGGGSGTHRSAHLSSGGHLLCPGHPGVSPHPADRHGFSGLSEVTPSSYGKSRGSTGSSRQPQPYSWLFLGLLMATLLLSHVIERSRLGYYLRAIKENEQAAAAMG